MDEHNNAIESNKRVAEMFPNLMEMNVADAGRFREQVARANGKVRILVHPFYKHLDTLEDTPNKAKYQEDMRQLVRNSSIEDPPSIIMMEAAGFKDEERMVYDLASEAGRESIFVVLTQADSPVPILNFDGGGAWFRNARALFEKGRDAKVWGKMVAVLKTAGVTDVELCGTTLYVVDKGGEVSDQTALKKQVESDWEIRMDEFSLGGCVSETAALLAENGFKIKFGEQAFPGGNTELKQAIALKTAGINH